MDDLLTEFLAETTESLGALDIALLKLERTPEDQETLSLIFRMVHTIKGTCGFLGLPRLEHVAHAGENVLGRMRDGKLVATPGVVSLILAAMDTIKDIVAALGRTGTEPDGDDGPLIGALDEAAEGRFVGIAAPAKGAGATPAMASMLPTAGPTPADPEPEVASGAQTIRVAVDVLDNLMTLVSELVLTRNQLLQLARTQQNDSFTVPLQHLSHLTSDLQEGVMKTRMQPISNAWAKLPRLVRDLARDLGKKIDLVMRGAETELDRQVLELIKDPLTHMVRNSGDHGLEDPAGRRAAGKSETGRITLNAFHEGGHITIEISDDGRGLPVDRIRAKALSMGIVTDAELAGMSGGQIQSLIFRPGFSTAAAVTAVSGRGVGMDVVKTNIEQIGGTIELQSTPGAGTLFTIKIPLTLAIVAALIVQAGTERFAIPQIGVVELVRLGSGNQLERIDGTPVLRLRDRLLPLVNLAGLLQLEPADGTGGTGQPDGGLYVVVAQVAGAMLGIIVDRVFDTEEIVVKPVAPILRHVTVFSGNTILGDGSVIMILDPSGIARQIGIGSGRDRGAETEMLAHSGHDNLRTSLLIVEAGGARLAVPLNLVARLEQIPRDKIELSSNDPVTQYRGKLMRLLPLDPRPGQPADWPETSSVLVFTEGDCALGLVVSRIVDVVQDRLDITLASNSPGLLGTAVIDGLATDVLDTGYYLTTTFPDWFAGDKDGAVVRHRVLLVEDSDFFRALVTPMLSAAGYEVTAVNSADAALRLRDSGTLVDAIVSDIEMPRLDGMGFARAVREGGAWQALPMIALTSHASPEVIQKARIAGFTDYVLKFERDALMTSLKQCLEQALGQTSCV
jgi:two-component system chemotaxis sensor kinase CheA